MKKRDVNLNGIVAFMCLILSIPLYFFYRANLEFEWLFNAVAFLGMFLLVFRFLGPLCVTFLKKSSRIFRSVPVEHSNLSTLVCN